MQKFISSTLLVLATIFTLPAAEAAVSPLSIGIIPPVQFPPADFTVTGARVNLIYGKHRDVYGLDVGVLGNITEQTFTGIGLAGGFNYTKGNTTAILLQGAGIANVNTNKTKIYGAQVALGLNMNDAESSVVGLQLAAVNLSAHTNVYGVQAGVFNKAKSVYGLQIGLVNVATDLHGIQIGLINFNSTGIFAVSPIINVGF